MCACRFHPQGFTRDATPAAKPTPASLLACVRHRNLARNSSNLSSFNVTAYQTALSQQIASKTKPIRKPPCTFTQTSVSNGRNQRRRQLPAAEFVAEGPAESAGKQSDSDESRIQNHTSVNSQLNTCGRARK